MIQQIANQLNKLIDVVSVEDMTGGRAPRARARAPEARRCAPSRRMSYAVMSCGRAGACSTRLPKAL